MDNFLIGALELGDQPASYGDGMLEARATDPNPHRTLVCGRTAVPAFCVSDGALEHAADTAPLPTQFCR